MTANNFENRLKTNLKRFANENNIDVDDIDEFNSLLIENTTLHELYDESEYIHINIPTGADAVTKYENTINDVATIDVTKYRLEFGDVKTNFDEIMNSLVATAEYYKGISKVYTKTDFVISDIIEIESAKQDNDDIHGIYIGSQERYLLNKAIDVLDAKISEMDEYQTEYYDNIA